VPSGTPVLDWTVPREWNIRDAWIKDARGRKLVDFSRSSLHVVGYSVPVHRRIAADELAAHLHSLPERPHAIPWRTSYYAEDWGFCVSETQRGAFASGEFEVCIDASLEPGHLSYGEAVLPGRSDAELLVSAHVCHPSLANDNRWPRASAATPCASCSRPARSALSAGWPETGAGWPACGAA
jgi:aminopeptidase-like protein